MHLQLRAHAPAIKGTMNIAKHCTEIFAGAIISLIQYVARPRYGISQPPVMLCQLPVSTPTPCFLCTANHEITSQVWEAYIALGIKF
jgi:hypothetical protein